MPVQAAKSSFSAPSTTVNKCASYCNIKTPWLLFTQCLYISRDDRATRR